MTDTEYGYDVNDLASAYAGAMSDDQYAAWSRFKETYGDDARRHFLEAVENGHVEVVEQKHGIRADGQWPRYNTGRLWLDFNLNP